MACSPPTSPPDSALWAAEARTLGWLCPLSLLLFPCRRNRGSCHPAPCVGLHTEKQRRAQQAKSLLWDGSSGAGLMPPGSLGHRPGALIREHHAVHCGDIVVAAGIVQTQPCQGQEAVGAEVAQGRLWGAQRSEEDLQWRREQRRSRMRHKPPAPHLPRPGLPGPAPTSVTSSGSCPISRKTSWLWRS